MTASPLKCIVFLRSFGYSYRKMAKELDVPSPTLCQIASGRRGFSWATGKQIQQKTEELLKAHKTAINEFLKGGEK